MQIYISKTIASCKVTILPIFFFIIVSFQLTTVSYVNSEMSLELAAVRKKPELSQSQDVMTFIRTASLYLIVANLKRKKKYKLQDVKSQQSFNSSLEKARIVR